MSEFSPAAVVGGLLLLGLLMAAPLYGTAALLAAVGIGLIVTQNVAIGVAVLLLGAGLGVFVWGNSPAG